MMKRLPTAILLAIALGLLPAATFAASPVAPAQSSSQQAAHPPDINVKGATSYAKHCAVCHGDQREGNLPGFPPLLDVNRQMKEPQIVSLIHTGRGRMPGFPKLPQEEVTNLLHFLATDPISTSASASSGGSSGITEAGRHLFQRNCAFCHGRDAAGGETGPDLTRSKLALADVDGDKISVVVRNGRPEKKMPAFNFSNDEIHSIVAFIHYQQKAAAAHPGSRRGVDVADLQTGNAAAGKQYFNGAGGCAKCHSPTGDLAGIASRFEGLQLERRMLYPTDAKSKVTVVLPTGKKITGVLAYQDEFTIGLQDSSGGYQSWSVNRIHYTIDSPADAHVALFSKYTDADIHNLMAYLQTLR